MEALIVDLVAWLERGPRPYEEVMEAWRTSCPRLSVWEEALDRRLVARFRGEDGRPSVAVTEAGRAWLAERIAAPA
jgi:hypothetical protein